MSHRAVQRESIPSQGPRVDVGLSKVEEKPGGQVGAVPVSRRVGGEQTGAASLGALQVRVRPLILLKRGEMIQEYLSRKKT